MTDRYNALIVALDRDIRDDDAQVIISAIQMIKGVNAVTGNAVNIDTYSAARRVTAAIREKLFSLIDDMGKL